MKNKTTVELLKGNDGRKSLVAIMVDGKLHEYVVCGYYDPTREIGSQWDWGHYFKNDELQRAIDYLYSRIPRERLEELSTLFKDGLIQDDWDSAMEYFEDTCEMTEEEFEYFGIE